jgi:hypothetical protein
VHSLSPFLSLRLYGRFKSDSLFVFTFALVIFSFVVIAMGSQHKGPRTFRCFLATDLRERLSFVGTPREEAIYASQNPEFVYEITHEQADLIAERCVGKPIPVIANHANHLEESRHVGHVTVCRREGDTLPAEFVLYTDKLQAARRLAAHIDFGFAREVSLGHWRKKCDPFELSIVQKGARPGTFITSGFDDLNEDSKSEMHNNSNATDEVRASAKHYRSLQVETKVSEDGDIAVYADKSWQLHMSDTPVTAAFSGQSAAAQFSASGPPPASASSQKFATAADLGKAATAMINESLAPPPPQQLTSRMAATPPPPPTKDPASVVDPSDSAFQYMIPGAAGGDLKAVLPPGTRVLDKSGAGGNLLNAQIGGGGPPVTAAADPSPPSPAAAAPIKATGDAKADLMALMSSTRGMPGVDSLIESLAKTLGKTKSELDAMEKKNAELSSFADKANAEAIDRSLTRSYTAYEQGGLTPPGTADKIKSTMASNAYQERALASHLEKRQMEIEAGMRAGEEKKRASAEAYHRAVEEAQRREAANLDSWLGGGGAYPPPVLASRTVDERKREPAPLTGDRLTDARRWDPTRTVYPGADSYHPYGIEPYKPDNFPPAPYTHVPLYNPYTSSSSSSSSAYGAPPAPVGDHITAAARAAAFDEVKASRDHAMASSFVYSEEFGMSKRMRSPVNGMLGTLSDRADIGAGRSIMDAHVSIRQGVAPMVDRVTASAPLVTAMNKPLPTFLGPAASALAMASERKGYFPTNEFMERPHSNHVERGLLSNLEATRASALNVMGGGVFASAANRRTSKAPVIVSGMGMEEVDHPPYEAFGGLVEPAFYAFMTGAVLDKVTGQMIVPRSSRVNQDATPYINQAKYGKRGTSGFAKPDYLEWEKTLPSRMHYSTS